MTVKRRRRFGGRYIFAAVAVLALLWCGYWYAASRIAAAGIGRLLTAMSSDGRQITCVDAGMGGFPLSLDLDCSGAKLSAVSDNLSAALDHLSATALLYRPGHVEATVAGPFVLDAPVLGIALTASWSQAHLRLDAGLNGLEGLAATLDGFAIDQTGPSPRLAFSHVAMRQMFVTAGPSDAEDYRIDAAASDIKVERRDGTALPPFAGQIALVAEKFGNATGTDPQRTLQAWAAKGGSLKVERLAFAAGPTSVQASGALVLAPSGLFSGRLTVRIVGLDRLPELAETLKPGSGNKVAQAVGMMSALTQPVADASGEAREIALLVQNGIVFAGMLPIGMIPRLKLQ